MGTEVQWVELLVVLSKTIDSKDILEEEANILVNQDRYSLRDLHVEELTNNGTESDCNIRLIKFPPLIPVEELFSCTQLAIHPLTDWRKQTQ